MRQLRDAGLLYLPPRKANVWPWAMPFALEWSAQAVVRRPQGQGSRRTAGHYSVGSHQTHYSTRPAVRTSGPVGIRDAATISILFRASLRRDEITKLNKDTA